MEIIHVQTRKLNVHIHIMSESHLDICGTWDSRTFLNRVSWKWILGGCGGWRCWIIMWGQGAAAVSVHPLEGDKSAITAPVVAEQVDPMLSWEADQGTLSISFLFLFYHCSVFSSHVRNAEQMSEVLVNEINYCLSITLLLNHFIWAIACNNHIWGSVWYAVYCICWLCCSCPRSDLE